MEDHKSLERKLRRYENRLTVLGAGIISLTVWSLIKSVMTFINDKNYLNKLINDPEITGQEYNIFIAFIVITVLIILLIQYYIGHSARREGFGRKKSWGYLVLTLLFSIIYLSDIFLSIKSFNDYYDSVSDGAVNILIDITIVISLIEIIYASVRVKLLRRSLSQEGH